MNAMKSNNVGWMVAAALAGALAVSGFQGGAPKFGMVDLGRVMSKSAFAKKTEEELSSALKVREDVLNFLQQHRTLSPTDYIKYRQSATRNPASAGDKSEIERITNEANRLETLERDLSTKPTPTDAERKQLEEFATRRRSNTSALQQFNDEMQKELANIETTARTADLERARDAIKEVASKQGFTVVFTTNATAYGANDLTDDAIKAANKKSEGK
jgi:Skp family chaperone for outer membrane proteins